MSLLSICQWIQETRLSAALSGSTWGYPLIGAIHVLGIAWFGGTVLATGRELRSLRRTGLAVMLLSGALLFWMEPLKCCKSASFCMKMSFFALVLVVPTRTRRAARFSLTLWAAIILAARGIAFF